MAMTNEQLRARVRDLIASGELPSERPVIYGTGAAEPDTRSDSRRRPPDTCLICTEPEPDEEARLLAACDKSQNKQLAPIVTVAIETGLRKSELLELTWDRVDMTRGVLRLEVTKSGRRREVPMRQAVYNVLAALPGEHDGRVWAEGSIRSAFENAVAAARLDDFHFHDLRHTFASRFVMEGGSLPALQQILGHATLAMTMRYSHLSPRHLRDEIEKTSRRSHARSHEALTPEVVSANIA